MNKITQTSGLASQVCRLIEDFEEDGQPTLAYLAAQTGVSRFHLQRSFKKSMGVSPREYGEARRIERLKAELKQGGSVTAALYDAGFGAPSRLYEKADERLGMTPASYGKGGRGAEIAYGARKCALGWLIVGATKRGLCKVAFADTKKQCVDQLESEFSQALIIEDDQNMAVFLDAVLALLMSNEPSRDLALDIRPTAFQAIVWRYLKTIPAGETRSYGEVARDIGKPKSARAVAKACAGNSIAVVIPCHRVVGADGNLRGYRWGMERKRQLLAAEKAR